MKKLLRILSGFLLVLAESFVLISCASNEKSSSINEEYDKEINQDVNNFNKIFFNVRDNFALWQNSKSLINISEYPSYVSKFNDFISFFEIDDQKKLIWSEIVQLPFLEHLVIDFKKKVNEINENIINDYTNFYPNMTKIPPITVLDDSIEFTANKVNFDKLIEIIKVENSEIDLKAITINFHIPYEIKFKEIQKSNRISGVFTVCDDSEKINNIQEKVEIWFTNFIYEIFKEFDNKFIDNSNNYFNNITINNTIWPLIAKKLDEKNILYNNKPSFTEIFDVANSLKTFHKHDSILKIFDEGYNSKKITKENFLLFFKEENKIFTEDDYYIKANIMYFLPRVFTIENLLFRNNYFWKSLKSSIKILIPKDKMDKHLNKFIEKILEFWHYYKLEIYKNKIVFNMNLLDFSFLNKKINFFNSDNTLNSKISLIFKTIFDIFNKKSKIKVKLKVKFWHFEKEDSEGLEYMYKLETISSEKNLIFKLFRSYYSDGTYPEYNINFGCCGFIHSFFITPDPYEINDTDNKNYQFLQIIEFKVN